MKKILEVPYKSQLDNKFDPLSTCNVTSIAMCLEYLGTKRREEYRNIKQFEDELYRCCLDRSLDRRKPDHMAQLIRLYGCRDTFTDRATVEAVKDWIDLGNPCITHGWFTESGHIIVMAGYDDKGFIVHDPYGEWFKEGYRTDLSGKNLHYSYNLIGRTCFPDSQFWVHFVERGDSL
jgi:hypothetical protein